MATNPIPPQASGSPSPPAQAPRKSNLLWWILGLFGVGVVILGVGSLLALRFLAGNVEVIQSGDKVEVRTPIGQFSAAKGKDETGLPQYPGATQSERGATVTVESPDSEQVVIVAAKYRSSDSVDKIDEWYREKLGPDFQRDGSGVTNHKRKIFGTTVKLEDIAYVSEKDDIVRIVVIDRKLSGAEIALVRIGKEEPK